MPYSPNGIPEYEVYDASTNDLLVSGNSTQDTSDVGSFYFMIDSDVTSFDRTLKVVWTYQIDFKTYTNVEYMEVTTPYAEREEIITELGLGSEPQDLNYFPDQKLRIAERIARLQINNYTGREFNQRVGIQVAYGMNSDTLIFSERMTAFTKIEQDDIVIYDSENGINTMGYDLELTETGQGIRIRNSSQLDVTTYPPTAYMNPPRAVFANNSRYKVYATLGYSYIPYQVKQAALLLISDNLYNDALWRQKYVSEFDTGQMKVKLRDTAFTGTGNLLADDMLDQFKITGIVVI
jgi:hypothetical protein